MAQFRLSQVEQLRAEKLEIDQQLRTYQHSGQGDGRVRTPLNYEIILKSLNFVTLSEELQVVWDLKLVFILNGIKSASSMHGCPFC